MLTLTLGDFLDRIPAELLEDGEHDRSIPLTFDLAPLSERIWRGDTQIPVTDIFQRVPNIFRADVMNLSDDVIRFPWNKVLTLIAETRAGATTTGLTPSGVEMLSLKLMARNLVKATLIAAAPCLRNAAPAGTAKSDKAAPAPTAAPSPAKPLALVASETPATPPEVVEPTAHLAPLSASAPGLAQLKAEHKSQLAALAAERDQAVAQIDPLRKELATHLEQLDSERRVSAEVCERLNLLEKGRGEIDPTVETLKAACDAAVARAAEFGVEHDAAISRIGDIMAERDDAIVRAEKLSADADAAVALATELSAQRDATAASVTQLTVERDDAIARAEKLRTDADAAADLPPVAVSAPESERLIVEHERQLAALAAERDQAVAAIDPLRQDLARHLEQAAAERRVAAEVREQLSLLEKAQGEIDRTIEALKAERDAELARAAKFSVERDESVARAEKLGADADAAFALATELTAERDAALASTAKLSAQSDAPQASAAEFPESQTEPSVPADAPEHTAWESRAIACLEADIEGYRRRVQTLLDERAALPKASEAPAIRLVIPQMPAPDAYSTLFQPRFRMPRAAAALALGFLAVGIVILSQVSLRTARTSQAGPSLPRSTFAELTFPVLAGVSIAEAGLTLQSPANEPTITLLQTRESPASVQ